MRKLFWHGFSDPKLSSFYTLIDEYQFYYLIDLGMAKMVENRLILTKYGRKLCLEVFRERQAEEKQHHA